jgi:hypothetical protein
VAAALANASCANPEDAEVCSAVMSYAEPVLTIDSATRPDGAQVESFGMSRIKLDGRPITSDLLRAANNERAWSGATSSSSSLHFGLEAGAGASITCRVPCGFGTMFGTVTFVETTRGGLDKVGKLHRVRVDYDSQHPGCGGALDDGTHIDLELPQAAGTAP